MNAPAEKALKDVLLEAHKTGTFLDVVYQASLADRDDRNVVAAELVALHNAGTLDVVAAFAALGATSNGPDFFLTRHVFETALPDINAPVVQVMRCVLDLCRRAGRDMMAGSIVNSFIEFCAKDAARPREALDAAKRDPDMLDLLTASIVAGALINLETYLREAVALLHDPEITVRRRAAFALGRIRWSKDTTPPEFVYEALEAAAQRESDDELLGSVARTAFALYVQNKTKEQRIAALIERALSRDGDLAVHAASEIAFFHSKELTAAITDILVPRMLKVNPAHKGTLDNIDYFLDHLLRRGESDKAIEFAETLLLAHPDVLSLQMFDSFAAKIRNDKGLLSKVVTRWFLRGDKVLCKGLEEMISASFGKNLPIDVDATELAPISSTRLIFVARKALGYLFLTPISAASVIVSLMRLTEEDETLEVLSDLLFDPLLINYSGVARKYIAATGKEATGKLKKYLRRSLRLLDGYIKGLRSVGEVPEFTPSISQREASYRLSSRRMFESMKAAEAKSPLLGIIHKSVLLYGRKSINYVYGPSGESHRTEIPLKSHSIQFEMPRSSQLDPFGIEHVIRIFRAERLR
jgi:hypothetical protein